MKISVVLDRRYGESASAELSPAFWLISSPVNKVLARRLRENRLADPNSAVFDGDCYSSTVEAARAIFPTVTEHHPDWTTIEFIGTSLDHAFRAAFAGEAVELRSTATRVVTVSRL